MRSGNVGRELEKLLVGKLFARLQLTDLVGNNKEFLIGTVGGSGEHKIMSKKGKQ